MSEQTATRWEQYNEAGRLFFLQGDLPRAEESFRTALDEAERPGGDRLRAATTLSNLAQLKYQQRSLDEAETLFTRSIEIRESVLGPDHVSVSQTLNNLAALHVARGRPERAEPLLSRALGIIEKNRPGDHPDVAVTLSNLAKLHFKRGDFVTAEPLLQRLLALKQALGRDHADVPQVLASLATVRQALGRADSAELLWREALAIREKTLSPSDRSLAPTLEGLAEACATQRKDAEALSLRQRALEIRLQAFGESHPTVAMARARIAELSAAANAPSGSVRHEPRLSSMRMLAVEDPAEASPENNAWLMESEPPSRLLDSAPAPIAPAPIAPAPIVPAPIAPATSVPAPSAPAPRPSRPVALRNSELATEERPPTPIVAPLPQAADGIGASADGGFWFAPPELAKTAPAPKAPEPLQPLPSLPPLPTVEPRAATAAVPASNSPPAVARGGEFGPPPPLVGTRSGEFGPPPQPLGTRSGEFGPPPQSPGLPGGELRPARAPTPPPRIAPPPPKQREPRAERRAEPRREPRRPRRQEQPEEQLEAPARRSSGAILAAAVVLLLLGAGGWFAYARTGSASAPAPAKAAARAAARVAKPVGERLGSVARIVVPQGPDSNMSISATTPSARPDITVPAPRREPARRPAAPAGFTPLVDSTGTVLPGGTMLPSVPTTLEAAAAATLGVDGVVRAIDDSAQRRVNAALPRVDVKPTDFKKTP